MGPRPVTILAASFAVMLAAAGVVVLVSQHSTARLLVASPDVASCAALDPPDAAASCLAPYFRDAVQAGQTREALGALNGLFRSGAIDDCHMLAHDLGHVAFDAMGDLTAAIAAGDAHCNGGYIHGVVEEALARGYGVSSNGNVSVLGWCDPVASAPDPTYMECVHGLGHGLMYRSGHDVAGSLAACDGLAWDDERAYCKDGVFMENSLQYRDLGESAYLASAPHACDRLPLTLDEFAACFRNVGEVAMMHYHHALPRAAAMCDTLTDSSERDLCHEGADTEAQTVAYQRAHT